MASGLNYNGLHMRFARSNKLTLYLIQLLVLIAFGFLSIMLGQDTNWDLQNYHLYNPYAFLNGRLNLDLAPAGLQTYFNPIIDLVYFWAVRSLPPRVIGFLLGVIQGLNFILIFNICQYCLKSIDLKSVRWAVILGLLGVLSVGFLSEIGTIMGDNIVSLFVLGALLMIIISFEPVMIKKRRVFFLLAFAGFVAGIGEGIKPICILYTFSMVISLLFTVNGLRNKLWSAAFFGIASLMGWMLIGAGWLWYIWHQTGNPIFPAINNIFHAKLAVLGPNVDVRFLHQNIFEKIIYPVIMTIKPLCASELSYKQVSWALVYLITLFLIIRNVFHFLRKLKWSPLSLQGKFLLIFFWVFFISWENITGIYRYLTAVEILIPLVVFIILADLCKSKLFVRLMIVIILCLAAVFNIHGMPSWGRSSWSKNFFRFQPTGILKKKIDAVILIGQPLAWIVPALDIKAPFIQIMPNFSVTPAYWQRAKSILNNSHRGKILAIYDPLILSTQEAVKRLKIIDFILIDNNCTDETGYIGKQKLMYRMCPVEPIINN